MVTDQIDVNGSLSDNTPCFGVAGICMHHDSGEGAVSSPAPVPPARTVVPAAQGSTTHQETGGMSRDGGNNKV